MRNTDIFTKIILKYIHEALKPLGFKKYGQHFYKYINDVILIINLQRSMWFTKDVAILTINTGIFSRTIAKKMGEDTDKPHEAACHFRARIGRLSGFKKDKWWEIHTENEAEKAGQEITFLLSKYALPKLNKYSSTEKLKKLWESGASPGLTISKTTGLTEYQINMYMKVLHGLKVNRNAYGEIHDLWEKFEKLPFPKEECKENNDLLLADSYGAGCIRSYLDEGTLEKKRIQTLIGVVEEIDKNISKCPPKTKEYFLKLKHLAQLVLEDTNWK